MMRNYSDLLCSAMLIFVCTGQAQAIQRIPEGTELGNVSPTPGGSRSMQQKKPTKTVTLRVQDRPLLDVVRQISQLSNIPVSFNPELPELKQHIQVDLKNKTALEAFTIVLKESGLTAFTASDGKSIIIRRISPKSNTTVEQGSQTISGVVVDSADGKPLANVTVSIDGKSARVLSDGNGRFVFKGVAPGRYLIRAQIIGYSQRVERVTVLTDEETSVRLTMVRTVLGLAEVVTTVAGEQRKVEMGTDVTRLDVPEIMKTAVISSVTDLLENRVKNLTVIRSSGLPGDPARIRLRGAGSVNANNDPILVVDGIRMYSEATDERNALNRSVITPSPIDQIDPNTIETIEVFHGPSATALYGSDAANGVIVITTKRGLPGRSRWTTTLVGGITKHFSRYPLQPYRFGTKLYGGYSEQCSAIDKSCILDSLVYFQAANDPKNGVFGTGHVMGVSTTVSGGSNSMTWSLTSSVNRDLGAVKLPDVVASDYTTQTQRNVPGWMDRPARYSQWALSAHVTGVVNPQLRFDLSTQLSNGDQRKTGLTDVAIFKVINEYIQPEQWSTQIFDGFARQNRSQLTNIAYAGAMNWVPTPMIPITVNGGINTQHREDTQYDHQFPNLSNYKSFGVGKNQVNTYTLNSYTQIPTWERRVITSVGFNYTKQLISDTWGSSKTIPPGVATPSVGLEGTYRSRATTTTGWYIEPRLNLVERFFFTPGFRLDQNGLSGKDAGLSGFPKLNFSYLISNENYFPWKNLFQSLRVRGAFGQAGVQPPPTAKLRVLSVADNVKSNFYTGAAALSSLGNTHIRPERSIEYEGGFDAELMGGRVTVEYTGYSKTRKDAIVSIPLAPSLSIQGKAPQREENIGVIRNSGHAISVGAQIVELPEIRWGVNGTLSKNSNKVVKITNSGLPALISTGGTYSRIVEGYPLWGIWLSPIRGVYDENNDGIITKNEIVQDMNPAYVGAQDPDFTLSLNSGLTLLQGKVSANIGMSYIGGFTQDTYSGQFNKTIINDTTIPWAARSASLLAVSYGRIQPTDVFRINSLSIAYQIPPLKFLRVSSSSVAFQMNNVWMKTRFRGPDPMVNSTPYRETVRDDGAVPTPRTYQLRIQLGN